MFLKGFHAKELMCIVHNINSGMGEAHDGTCCSVCYDALECMHPGAKLRSFQNVLQNCVLHNNAMVMFEFIAIHEQRYALQLRQTLYAAHDCTVGPGSPGDQVVMMEPVECSDTLGMKLYGTLSTICSAPQIIWLEEVALHVEG